MNLLSVNNLAKIGREKPLFTNVTFGLDEGDKAAIIGRNGTGKSTLLSVIAGTLEADEGSVVTNKSAGVSYLSQNPVFSADDTIREHIFKSNSPKLNIIKEYEELLENIEQNAAHFEKVQHEMDASDLWNYEAQVRSILSTLGINDMERKMGTLSGGMVKKVALAQVLVEDTKLLLLDEPTNHLDISTIFWLQNYLHDTKRSVLMVTHDRYFLDAVCNNIYELARNRLKLYQGNYSTYLDKKTVEAEIEENTERRIESVLRVEREWLLRGPCARGTKQKARKQHDEALINREKFSADKGFTFEVAGRRLGGKVLELHHISKSYPKGFASQGSAPTKQAVPVPAPVIKDFSYTFTAGQKIGVFGDNGSGKSTLLNIITGNLESDTGSVVVGVNTVFGYYQQNPVFKDLNMTVLEYIKEGAEVITTNSGKTLSASQFLEEFGFEGKIQHSALSTLSGGERKRVFLVRLLMQNPNFLVLDEPTNDFDIFTMNILEQFLESYKGCLLIVSHDRYFMDKVADTLFILEDNGEISGYVGKCSEYIDYREELRKEKELAEKAEREAKQKVSSQSVSVQKEAVPPVPQKRKMSFKEQREFEQIEAEIAELEEKKTQLEEQMASSDFATAQKAGEEYKAVSDKLEADYARWDELSELM